MEPTSTWSRLTLPLHQVAGRVSRALPICLVFTLFIGVLPAQEEDPSDVFLKAYLSAQQAQKLESENQFKAALAKFRFAGSLIEELKKSHSTWQSAVVEYRGRKIGEEILRIQERISTHNGLSAASSPLPDVVPSLPEDDSWTEPGPEVVAQQDFESISQRPGDGAIEEATRKLRRKIDDLQTAVEKSNRDLQTARKEKDAVSARLEQTSSDLENAQKEIKKSKESERELRDQLVQAQDSQANSSVEQLRAQVAGLKNKIALSEDARAAAERERDEANGKLAQAIERMSAAERQGDEALNQLKTDQMGPAQRFFATNLDLELDRGNPDQNLLLSTDSENAEESLEVKRQVTDLQKQLTESHKQNQYLVARIAELWVQLDAASAQLQSAKSNGQGSEETDHLIRENQLLRDIVIRERHEEAGREGARKLVIAELERLKIKSDALNKQIGLLTQPVAKLSPEELDILRQPVVSFSDNGPTGVTAGFIFAKKSANAPVVGQTPGNNKSGLSGDGDSHGMQHALRQNFHDVSGPENAIPANSARGSE